MTPTAGERWSRKTPPGNQRGRVIEYLIVAVALHVERFDGATAERLIIYRDADYEPAKVWAQPLGSFLRAFERVS